MSSKSNMVRFKALIFFFLFPLCCQATERVEVVTNGCYSVARLDAYLKEKGGQVDVVECNLRHYPGLLKGKSRIEKLKSKLLQLTSKKITVDEEVKKILFMNIPYGVNLSRLPAKKLVLFMFEPPLRLRKMYKKKVKKAFSRIYTFDDDLVDNKKYFKAFYSELRPMIEEIVPFDQKKLCTMVAGYTSDKSKHPEELYSERKKTIRFFESKKEKGFAFYGRNWDPTKFPSYGGPVEDKIGVLKNYRFVIAYENSKDIKGYITEKIFDCFAAGTIPIYWGANNIDEYIPKECFIDRREYPDHEALYAYLKSMTEEEYEGYLNHIRTFLKSEQAQLFSIENFKEILLQAVNS